MAQLPDPQTIKNAHMAKKLPLPASMRRFFNGALTKKAKNLRTKNRLKVLTVKFFASHLLF
jgi:hypothetical protein